MKKPVAIFLIILAAILAACGPSQRPALAHNRSLWQAQAIRHYRFNFRIGCNCPWAGLMPLAVEVQDGEVVSMTGRNGGDISRYLDTFRPHATVESLFDLVDAAIASRAYKLDVKYDPTYGFPASIVIDPSRLVMDDETGYYVTNLEVLP